MRIEATGALRRKEAGLHSIEMIASPQEVKKYGYWNNQVVDLGGEIAGTNRLEAGVELLTRRGVLKRLPSGLGRTDYATECPSSRYSLQFKQAPVTIYSVTSYLDWGVEFLLHTGDDDFVDFIVKRAVKKGFTLSRGRLRRLGKSVSTPEEADVFRALDLEWIEPENRHLAFVGRMDAT